MPHAYDLTIKQLVKFWNRGLSKPPKDFFFSLGKAALAGASMNVVRDNRKSIGCHQ
jgi:hypothetical protein